MDGLAAEVVEAVKRAWAQNDDLWWQMERGETGLEREKSQ